MTARTGEVRPFEPPPAARESLQGHYAGFASRFAAFAVDLVVLTGIFILVLAAINFAASVLTGNSVHFNHGNTWVVVAYAVWAFIYFAHFWGLNGKTPGGALFGVQVVTNDGGDVSGRRAIGRTLAFPLSFLILCLGFLGIFLGDQRRALHDVIAGTVVIYCWDARAARLRMLSRPRYSAPHAPPESGGLPGSPGPADPPSLTRTRRLCGFPSWGPELLARTHYALGSGTSSLDTMPELYAQWERWAADVGDSHTTYLPLVRFRSPAALSSWVTALLAVWTPPRCSWRSPPRPRQRSRPGCACAPGSCASTGSPGPWASTSPMRPTRKLGSA